MSQLPLAREHHHPRWRHLLVPGGCILGLSALALLFWITVPPLPSSGISANRAALASALGAARPLEGRITGGFDYLPLKTPVQIFDGFIGGYQRPPRLETSQTRRTIPFARQIELEYQRNPTPQALGDKALLILIGRGNHETALPLLQEAVQRDPQNPTLWSDLAAMYLASTRPTPPSRFLALEAAHRAITKDPSLLEARFNFALALEKCSLLHQAARAWEAYIRLDPNSGWSEEARNHLKRLHTPRPNKLWRRIWKERVSAGISLASLPYGMARVGINQIAREDAMEEVLGRWGSLAFEGRSVEAARELDSAKKIGDILPSDKTVSDAVNTIETASPETKTYLAHAHHRYQLGIEAFQTGRMDLAESQLEVAASLFSRSDSPFKHWTNLILAEIAFYRSDFPTMESLLAKIRSGAHLTRYPALNQRTFWVEGLSNLSQMNLADAQEAFRAASWMRFDEEEFTGVANLYLSKSSEEASDPDWLSLYRALSRLPRFPESKHLAELFRSLAAIFSEDHPTVALFLLNEALEAANILKDPSTRLEILIDRSRLAYNIGDKKDAQRDLSTIEKKWTTLQGNIFRHKLGVKKGVARCQILGELPPTHCITILTDAIEYYLKHDQRLLADTYRIRADVHHKLSNTEAEEADLMKAVRFYERGIASSGISRSLRFDQAKDLYERIADLELSRGNHVRALELIDHSRSIFLAHAPKRYKTNAPHSISFPFSTGCNLRPYSRQEVLDKLPKWITLIEYVSRDEGIEAWVFRNRSARRIKLGVTRKQILGHIPPIPDPPGGQLRVVHIDAATPELSQWLLQPILPWLPEDGDLFFLAGPLFEQVDFAALKHPKTQQSLCSSNRAVGSMYKQENFSLNGDLARALKLLRGSPTGRLADVNKKAQPERPYTSLSSILETLPENSALIEYSIIKGKLLIWVVSQGHSNLHSISINTIKLDDLVDRWLMNLNNAHQDYRAAILLHKLLINPIKNHLPRSGNIIIVPDKSLAKIPFGVLLDPESDRYLIEDYSVSITTSATLYLQQLERYPSPDHKNWSVYAISNPISSEKPVHRASLPSAVSEVENIVKLFPGSEMVAGRDANYRWSVRTRSHPIVHFAGHWDPLIKFYDGTIEADNLHIDENVKLIVLSACRTVSHRYWLKGSIFGIAGNFLDRWAPAVVATYWNVDDRVANNLLLRFYKHLRVGQDGANALRSAQLELLYGENKTLRHPSKWASFQLFGFGGI